MAGVESVRQLDVILRPRSVAVIGASPSAARCIKTNPIDLTGDATAKMFSEVMNATWDHYDTLGVIFGDALPDVSQVVTPGASELIVFLGGVASLLISNSPGRCVPEG